jgi:tetratricopeptide (TPR) repeat protein
VALLARLEQRLRVLTGVARDVPARQQTLRKTIAWSYDLLSEAEQTLLARLSVFAGGCALSAVTAICGSGSAGDTLEALAVLVDKSLLQHDSLAGAGDDDPRFVMLQTVHEFAREQLAGRAEAAELRLRHARHYTALAEEVMRHRHEGVGLEWSARMDRDEGNLRAALDWCAGQAESGDGEALDLALRLGIAEWRAADCWGFGEGVWVRQKLSHVLSHAHATASPHARAEALLRAGAVAEKAGAVSQATALYEEALTVARAAGDPSLAVWPLVHLAMGRTDPAQRRAELEEALAVAHGAVTDDPADDAHRQWGAQIFLACHHLDVGELSCCRALAEEVHAHSVAQGDLFVANMALDVLAHIARAEGQTATARRLFAESLTLRRLHGDGFSMGHTLRFLGEIAEEQGETEQARVYYGEALAVLRDAWDVNRIAAVLRGVAALALLAGEARRVLRLAGAVSALHARCGMRIYMDVAPAQRLWARASWEQLRETARHALGPDEGAAAWAAGQAMALEQAIAEALDWLAPPARP